MARVTPPRTNTNTWRIHHETWKIFAWDSNERTHIIEYPPLSVRFSSIIRSRGWFRAYRIHELSFSNSGEYFFLIFMMNAPSIRICQEGWRVATEGEAWTTSLTSARREFEERGLTGVYCVTIRHFAAYRLFSVVRTSNYFPFVFFLTYAQQVRTYTEGPNCGARWLAEYQERE